MVIPAFSSSMCWSQGTRSSPKGLIEALEVACVQGCSHNQRRNGRRHGPGLEEGSSEVLQGHRPRPTTVPCRSTTNPSTLPEAWARSRA